MKNRKVVWIVLLAVLAVLSYLGFLMAVSVCREAKKVGDDFARAEEHLETGNRYYRLHDYSNAVVEYRRAIEAHPAGEEWLTARENILAAQRMLSFSNSAHRATFLKDVAVDSVETALMRSVTSFFSKKRRWPMSEREIREWCARMSQSPDFGSASGIRFSETSNGDLLVTYSLASNQVNGTDERSFTIGVHVGEQ